MNLRRHLDGRLSAALSAVAGTDLPAVVVPSARRRFGDYQANGVMAAAKRLRTNPRALAEKVLAEADLADLAASLEVAGPGFINIRLRDEWIARQLQHALGDERLGAERPDPPRTVVVDYSHPNVAKEMHVGHLRSTIIGDALARVLEFLGHRVIRQNHIGDWGTQFGMLLAHLAESGTSVEALDDLEAFYRQAQQRFQTDERFAEAARRYVVRLQSGDAEVLRAWRGFIEASLRHCQRIYERLGVSLTRCDVRGESAYNDDLPKVVADLQQAGLIVDSQGAKCVFLEELRDSSGEITPVIVQKSDGGYLYATTDLAALRYRVNTLGADRILYVVDARQSLHLRQVFAVARAAGWVGQNVSLEHLPFGTMLGSDGRPFKTRAGGTVRLMDLLDEAERRALELVREKSPDLPDSQQRRIARAVGIGAVKYADLAQNRASDYVFSYEKMLSLEGNTAPYMQYAYARIRSIFRKAGPVGDDLAGAAIALDTPAERDLAVRLLQFPETVEAVGQECLPNLLCAYLYDLAGAFTGFYENCPVLQSDEPLRRSRLALCELTARTIRTGLDLLGIETIEQM